MPHTTEKEKNSNLLEVEFLAACIHPNIVRYLNAFQIKNEVWVFFLFEQKKTVTNKSIMS